MKVIPSGQTLGALIEDIDLSAISQADINAIKELLYKHKVVSFKNQKLTLSQYQTFAEKMGTFSDNFFLTPISDEYSHIVEVKRKAEESSNEVSIYGGEWHHDFSMKVHPPDFTMLYSEIIPPVGGETLFSDQVEALSDLSQDLKAFIVDKKSLHSARKGWGIDGLFSKNIEKRSMKLQITQESGDYEFEHPMVLSHPHNKLQSLYVNEGFVEHIVGIEKEESEKILMKLYLHQRKKKFIYSLKWEPDMLTIWDNRLVIHKAVGGYNGYERKLYRIQVNDTESRS